MTLLAFDFESHAIESRPRFPPEPVGLAIYIDGDAPYYMAWGHPVGNNCSRQDAVDELKGFLEDPQYEYIAHNLPFDASIIEEKLELVFPWERAHDTMLQAFLYDPFGELSLKPLAEAHLGEPPSEQDAVRDWLIRHGVVRANDKSWGAHISRAPGGIVGPYACGDVRKTLNLYKLFKENLELRDQGIFLSIGQTTKDLKTNVGKPHNSERIWANGSVPDTTADGWSKT